MNRRASWTVNDLPFADRLRRSPLALALYRNTRVPGELRANVGFYCKIEVQGEAARPPPSCFVLPGCIVEAGAYKGGSASKLSLAARLAGRRLYVFDSFSGLPIHDEPHSKSIFGGQIAFPAGAWRGTIDEVRATIDRYGVSEVCELVPGWFDDTLPGFTEPVAVAYIDVDLATSTRICLAYLYPLLIRDGVLFSQDGHVPLVVDEIRAFAARTGARVVGLGERKLVELRRTTSS